MIIKNVLKSFCFGMKLDLHVRNEIICKTTMIKIVLYFLYFSSEPLFLSVTFKFMCSGRKQLITAIIIAKTEKTKNTKY